MSSILTAGLLKLSCYKSDMIIIGPNQNHNFDKVQCVVHKFPELFA